jgi:hypothetical protein
MVLLDERKLLLSNYKESKISWKIIQIIRNKHNVFDAIKIESTFKG